MDIFIGTQTGLTFVVKSKREMSQFLEEIDCNNVSSVGISNRTSGMAFTSLKTPTKQAMSSPIKKEMDNPSASHAQVYVSSSGNQPQEPNELRNVPQLSQNIATPSCSYVPHSSQNVATPSCSYVSHSSQNVATPSCSTINGTVSTSSVPIPNRRRNFPGLRAFPLVKPRLIKDIFMTFLARSNKEMRKLYTILKENSIVDALMVTRIRADHTDLSRYIHVYLVVKEKMKHSEIQKLVEGLTDLCCVDVKRVANAKALVAFMCKLGSLKWNIKTPRLVNEQKKKIKGVVLKIGRSKPVSRGPFLNPTPPYQIVLLPTCENNSLPVSHDESMPLIEIPELEELNSKFKETFAKREAAQNTVASLKRQVNSRSQELAKKKLCLQSATEDLDQLEKECDKLKTAVDLLQELQKQQQHIEQERQKQQQHMEQQKRIEEELKKKLVQAMGSAFSIQDSKK